MAVVNSLREDVKRMEKEAEQREAENRLFREQILKTIVEEKAATEERFSEERRLREAADARLQALLELEVVERQRQNCLVANAISNQVTLFSLYIHHV